MTRAQVLCFGEALWDLIPGGRLPGGAPMNVALRLAALGVDTRFLSRVGDDELGRELVAYMEKNDLRTDHVQTDSHLPTGCVNADTSNPHSVHYEIVAPAAWDRIDANDYLDAAGSVTDVVVFGSLAARHDVSRRSLMQLLERARLKIFDVNLRPPFTARELVEPLLQTSNWVKLNEHELAAVSAWLGVDDTDEHVLAAVAAHYALDVVCITRGAEGATVYSQGALITQPAFDVDVVDTIGCGDAFLSTWLAHLLEGGKPAQALRRACAAGAIVASRPGANALVTDAMIDELIGTG